MAYHLVIKKLTIYIRPVPSAAMQIYKQALFIFKLFLIWIFF
jgi:hypothetical protein